jgi:hypothetical protein
MYESTFTNNNNIYQHIPPGTFKVQNANNEIGYRTLLTCYFTYVDAMVSIVEFSFLRDIT